VDVDPSFVITDDAEGGGEAHADSFFPFLGGEEGVEDALADFFRHTTTGVGDFRDHVGSGFCERLRPAVVLVYLHVFGCDEKVSAVGHGVARVHGEVEEDLVHLSGVAECDGGGRGEVRADADVFVDGAREETEDFLDGLVKVYGDVLVFSLSGESEELGGEVRGAFSGQLDGAGGLVAGAARRAFELEYAGVTEYCGEEVVEVVGDASGKAADGVQPLGLAKLFFQAAAFGDVGHECDEADLVAAGVEDGGGGKTDDMMGAVLCDARGTVFGMRDVRGGFPDGVEKRLLPSDRDDRVGFSDGFVFGPTEDADSGGVPEGDFAFDVEDDDREWRALNDGGEELVQLFEGFLDQFPAGDVHVHAEHAEGFSAGRVCDDLATREYPAPVAGFCAEPVLYFVEGDAAVEMVAQYALDRVLVVGMNVPFPRLGGILDFGGVVTEHYAPWSNAHDIARGEIPVPESHFRTFEAEAQALLGFAELPGAGFKEAGDSEECAREARFFDHVEETEGVKRFVETRVGADSQPASGESGRGCGGDHDYNGV